MKCKSIFNTDEKVKHIKEVRESWEHCQFTNIVVEPCFVEIHGNKVRFSNGGARAKFAAKASFVDAAGMPHQTVSLFHTAIKGELNFSEVETPGIITFHKKA